MKNYDFLIVGGGIVGLTVARALALRRWGSIAVLEKEPSLGCHASGRNSGVLHAGIYYPADSLKAKVCRQGARMMHEYAAANRIPVRRTGKVIVAPDPQSTPQVDVLYNRALANGALVEKITPDDLARLEPEARTCGAALYSPETAVINPQQVLKSLEREAAGLGIDLKKSTPALSIDAQKRRVQTPQEFLGYGYLVNAAGLHADRMAQAMGIGRKYRILPFKGIYYKLRPEAAARFRHAVYPVPDLSMPFLGVHLTPTVDGDVMAGPTAIPALGRENYGLVDGINLGELPSILRDLAVMMGRNTLGFRNLALEEAAKYLPLGFVNRVRRLAPSLKPSDFLPGQFKVGLRAQLVDKSSMQLVMDFVVETGPSSLHILNAISPAFTGSLAFAEVICDQILANSSKLPALQVTPNELC